MQPSSSTDTLAGGTVVATPKNGKQRHKRMVVLKRLYKHIDKPVI